MLTWAERQDPVRWRNLLARLVPLMIPPYLLAVAFVNDLLSPQWRRMSEALTAFDEFGLLPFYHHYIVSKAQAAESVAVHLLTFAPIGVMVTLRRGGLLEHPRRRDIRETNGAGSRSRPFAGYRCSTTHAAPLSGR